MKLHSSSGIRRLLFLCILGACAGSLVLWFHPEHSKILNLAFLCCVAAAWLGCVILAWRWPLSRWALALPFVAVIPFVLPGKDLDMEELREDYVRRMEGFEGTKYHWGGEGSRGIDCSGLPRRALRDALLAQGMKHFNGRAYRAYAEQWWFDASAKALSQGYRNYTAPLDHGGTIREMDYGSLIPGDLAVTTDGVHILAYAGDGRWIQADPGIGAVATLDGRTSDNSWFAMPVTTHRWAVLSGGGKDGNHAPNPHVDRP